MDIAIGCNFLYGTEKGIVKTKEAVGMVMDRRNTKDIALIPNDRILGKKKKVQELDEPGL